MLSRNPRTRWLIDSWPETGAFFPSIPEVGEGDISFPLLPDCQIGCWLEISRVYFILFLKDSMKVHRLFPDVFVDSFTPISCISRWHQFDLPLPFLTKIPKSEQISWVQWRKGASQLLIQQFHHRGEAGPICVLLICLIWLQTKVALWWTVQRMQSWSQRVLTPLAVFVF